MIELACPWLLLLAFLPLLIWLLVPRAQVAATVAVRVPFYNAVLPLSQDTKKTQFLAKRTGLFFLIWLLLTLAAAGPRWVGEPRSLTRDGRNIMMVLDLSGSMDLTDMLWHGRPASRLFVVKQAAEEFVKERDGDNIGLILFGTQAYLQTPLTYDRHSVLMRIQDATVGLAGNTTSIGDALGLAVKRLQSIPKEGRVVILLTDGANNSGILTPIKAAEVAKDEGIKVYTIGLGAEVDPRAANSVFLALNASADLDEPTLKAIANMTGGQYFRATDSKSLNEIYERINRLETVKQDDAMVRPQIEYYPWPLAGALLLLGLFLLSQSQFKRRALQTFYAEGSQA